MDNVNGIVIHTDPRSAQAAATQAARARVFLAFSLRTPRSARLPLLPLLMFLLLFERFVLRLGVRGLRRHSHALGVLRRFEPKRVDAVLRRSVYFQAPPLARGSLRLRRQRGGLPLRENRSARTRRWIGLGGRFRLHRHPPNQRTAPHPWWRPLRVTDVCIYIYMDLFQSHQEPKLQTYSTSLMQDQNCHVKPNIFYLTIQNNCFEKTKKKWIEQSLLFKSDYIHTKDWYNGTDI